MRWGLVIGALCVVALGTGFNPLNRGNAMGTGIVGVLLIVGAISFNPLNRGNAMGTTPPAAGSFGALKMFQSSE